ncbi:MAG TPA: DEAD/DEAH box helicase [Candidatus Limnocylindrales bacterium]|nr:DEAD/DEAH box helicase [Candidatus Limnocylindrales bacterium]
MHFQDLSLIEPLLRAVRAEGYETPTPIQERAIPYVLAGRDLIGCAQTGTGKTAAFALPILQHLTEKPASSGRRAIRTLVLSPTRELATQIADGFKAYGRHTGLRPIVVFGGVGQQTQVDALRRGPDILVATPGRLLDLMNQGHVNLKSVEVFVLDEADRMLDMGFIHDVRKIIAALPSKRQTLLFSATMPQAIQELADQMLVDPVKVEVTPSATTVETIDQSVYFVVKNEKRALLEHLLRDAGIRRALVFTRTKHGANKLAEQLERAGIGADAIHGNKSQSAREKALSDFKRGNIRVLVATDIAARGIDVDDVTHVINYELPNEPESYVHRIGRTARAGASGTAYSFCDAEERAYLHDIEKLTRQQIMVVTDHAFAADFSALPMTSARKKSRGNQNQQSSRRLSYEPRPGRGHQPSNSRSHAPAQRSASASATGSYSHLAQPGEIASRPEPHHAAAENSHNSAEGSRTPNRRRRSRSNSRDRMPV